MISNRPIRVYLGKTSSPNAVKLAQVNYVNGYIPYIDKDKNEVYIQVSETGSVFRAPDSEMGSIPDGLYIFEKTKK